MGRILARKIEEELGLLEGELDKDNAGQAIAASLSMSLNDVLAALPKDTLDAVTKLIFTLAQASLESNLSKAAG